MPMLIIGVLLLIARWAEFGPFATMSWWWVALPFAAAVLWWEFADSSGLTKRREIEKMEERKRERREKAMENLGMGKRRAKVITRAQKAKAVVVSADPTFVERGAPTKPIDLLPPSPPPARREPKL
jgi:small Trp-rich protein